MAKLKIRVTGVDELRRRLRVVLSGNRRKAMSQHVGERVLDHVRDHLDTMAPKRHRVAKRLGAKPTHHLEYASGRLGGVNADGQAQTTELTDVRADGLTITIRGTPGLLRAFGPVTAKPRRAKWLTIPIHKSAYGKRVAELRNEGHVIFRPGRARILAEVDGSGMRDEGRGKKKRLRPLYALCRETTAPRDRGLLPTQEKMKAWAKEAAEGFLATEGL